uniref:Centrosomal protein 43 n=1 Tax=Monopterus albus TaxID=43700 RepID=A0A3Q3R0Q3_MONAL
MSAAEDDTELRDLLIQNLENSGVLNKLKAEMRAAVFLAMEEQDKVENKTPLINENMKKCLSTKDGRLVASLILDFLQVFNLDFTLAVFQPEINSLNGLDGRDQVCRELGLSESEVNRNSPVLLELIRRGRHNDKPTEVRLNFKKFRVHDESRGRCSDFWLKCRSLLLQKLLICTDLNIMELSPAVVASTCSSVISTLLITTVVDLSHRLNLNLLCSHVVGQDSEGVMSLGKADFQQQVSDKRMTSFGLKKGHLELEAEYNLDDGDSFFDDPLPKPQKTYASDFSHRSDLSKSELSIGEDIEEVSIEGPDHSDKLDESTQDLSISQLSQSHGADYMEEVA